MTPHRLLSSIRNSHFFILLSFGLLLGAGSTLAQEQSRTDRGSESMAKVSAESRSLQIPFLTAPVQVELPPPPSMRYVPGLEEPLVAAGLTTSQELLSRRSKIGA